MFANEFGDGSRRPPSKISDSARDRHCLPTGTLIGADSENAHPYWAAAADQQLVTQLLFMKNMAILGGLLVIAALGPGPASMDARKSA